MEVGGETFPQMPGHSVYAEPWVAYNTPHNRFTEKKVPKHSTFTNVSCISHPPSLEPLEVSSPTLPMGSVPLLALDTIWLWASCWDKCVRWQEPRGEDILRPKRSLRGYLRWLLQPQNKALH